MVFECKIIGAVFLVLKDLHRLKTQKWKLLRTSRLFAIRINVPPHTNAQMLSYPRRFKHQFICRTNVERKIFGRVSGSSVRSFRSAFPAPPLLTSTWKTSDLGWPKSWFLLGVPWSVAVGTWWRIKWLGLCSYTVWLCFMVLWYVFFCCWVLLGTLKYREEESDEKNVSNDR